eukprot:6579490-Prorocentrum_lima.AAC.1
MAKVNGASEELSGVRVVRVGNRHLGDNGSLGPGGRVAQKEVRRTGVPHGQAEVRRTLRLRSRRQRRHATGRRAMLPGLLPAPGPKKR